ncbi:nuclear transport factor 2 family protein [Oligoflexus tunisiensis]|uniref:nuclear transport factor 2 family protein n=1 Tax=Oligoflexus tunisiensis TaxID=708132 RepID=UPI00114CB7E5|nr:nuclear transport factor 2 family protein [Oligoflexus tunisiensis]
MKHDPQDIVRACYRAYVEKDRELLENLITEDFHFTSPLDNRIDRPAYFNRCWPNSAMIQEFTFIHVCEQGEQVFVTYEALNKNGKRFRNTEIATVRGGRIVDVEVYFGWNIPHEAEPGGFINP